MGLALGMALKFYNSVAKGLKLKVRKFLWQKATFVEIIGEKLVGGSFGRNPILNKVKENTISLTLWKS